MVESKKEVETQLLANRIQHILKTQAKGVHMFHLGAAWKLRRLPDFPPPINTYGGFYYDRNRNCIYAFTCDTDYGDWEDYAREHILASWHNQDEVIKYERLLQGEVKKYARQPGVKNKPRGEYTYLPGELFAEQISMCLDDGMTQADIARKYEVSQAYVSTIKRRFLMA